MRKSILLVALLPALPCSAQPRLQSAREILDLPASKAQQPWDGPGEYSTVDESSAHENNALGQWQRDARALRNNSAKNSAAENAKAWLDLAARRMALPNNSTSAFERRPDFSQLVQALPDPNSWAEILKLARAEYVKAPNSLNSTNLYFAAKLQDDKAAQAEALRSLYRILAPQFEATLKQYPVPSTKAGARRDYEAEQKARTALARFDSLSSLLLESPSREQKKLGIEWKIKSAGRSDRYNSFDVPDLVGELGEAEAKPLLRQILLLPQEPNWIGVGKTPALAQRMWLADAQLQKRPLWKLPSSPSSWKFALVMLRKFPEAGKGDDAFTVLPVKAAALRGVVAQGQYAQATQLLDDWLENKSKNGGVNTEASLWFPYGEDSDSREFEAKKLAWVESTLKKHPQLPWWDGYRELSLKMGETPRRLQLLKSLVAQSETAKVSAADQRRYLNALSAAYLDSNDAQRGGDTLVRSLQSNIAAKDASGDFMSQVEALLHLTRVVPNAGWMQVAKKGAQLIFSVPTESWEDTVGAKRVRLALHFAEQNEQVFAQSLLASAYRREILAQNKENYYGGAGNSRAYLFGLMSVYKSANKPAEMAYLLEHARGWGEKEITPILEYNTLSEWDESPEDPETKVLPRLGYLAAWALAKTNHRAQASQVTRALIERVGGYDAAYQLLVDLEGNRADAFLQQQAARDRFEERPLIWRAFLARRAGKWGEAQKLAQAAIAIDPSDGEEGRGDRLRAYSELGAALHGQGKATEAQKVEEAVKAIRLAENADYLRIAGLTTRAIEQYQRSLRYFDDAYCVQSRLAVQLVGLGRYQDAAAHFRKAYELMPRSFGRLESHCFGCEGVFGGKEENGIARQVFMQLEKARPNDPKIAYLSGYWRSTAGQNQDAVRYFKRAVALDPLYLSAWRQLSYQRGLLTPAQIDETTLKLIELDPRGVHDSYGVSFEMQQDYRGLWKTTQAVLPRKNPQLKANLPLPASTTDTSGMSWNTWTFVKRPAGAISSQRFVNQISNLA